MSPQYTLFLGTQNWSSWSLRPYVALRATGADYREVVVRLREPDTRANIRKLTGAERVPALRIEEHGDGTVVFDSLAICETLAERHPEARLWPADSRARAFARSISAAMHSGFAVLRSDLSMEFARRFPTPTMTAELRDEIAEITGYWNSALEAYGGADGFLFDHLTIADCMYSPVVSRFRTYGVTLEPRLEAYCRRVCELPAMQDWLVDSRREVEAGLP
jgi:glutathione S-transferase